MGQSGLGSQGCPAVGHSASSAFCHACQDDEAVSIPTNSGAHCDMGLGQLLVDVQAVLPGVGEAGAPKINMGSVGPRICPTQMADLQGAVWAHHTQTTPVP